MNPLSTYLSYFFPTFLSPLLVAGALWLGRRTLTTTVLVTAIGGLTLALIGISMWVVYIIIYLHPTVGNGIITYSFDGLSLANSLITVSATLSTATWIVALASMMRLGQRRWALTTVLLLVFFQFFVQANNISTIILFPHFPLTIPFFRDHREWTPLIVGFWEIPIIFLLVYALVQRRSERVQPSPTVTDAPPEHIMMKE